MRIVGGQHRGRTLASPQGLSTRPTGDRARQAVFNILEHAPWRKRDVLQDADVLDAFAGTGAMGLEALSRGARHAVFIEKDFAAAKTCKENIDKLGEDARSVLQKQDAVKPLPRPLYMAHRSLIFLDPPYGKDLGEKALVTLAAKDWLSDGAICVFEMAKKQPEKIPAGFTQLDERDYGIARVVFLEWAQPQDRDLLRPSG